MYINYEINGEDYTFWADYDKVDECLIGCMVRDGMTKEQAKDLLEDDEERDDKIEYYTDEIKDYFEEEAKTEAEQGSFDGFDSYDDFCRWRNPNL